MNVQIFLKFKSGYYGSILNEKRLCERSQTEAQEHKFGEFEKLLTGKLVKHSKISLKNCTRSLI